MMVELVFFSCGGLWAGWPAKGSATKKRTKTNNSTNNGARSKEREWSCAAKANEQFKKAMSEKNC